VLHSTLALEHSASAHVVISSRPRVVLDHGRELREARGDRRGAPGARADRARWGQTRLLTL